MGDFNLGSLGAILAGSQALGDYGAKKKKQHDAGEEYYLELSTSKNFKQRPNAPYKRGMTKVDVRKLFIEDTETEDNKIINKWERKMLRAIFKGDTDPLKGIPEDAEISREVMKLVSTIDKTNMTEQVQDQKYKLAVQIESRKVLQYLFNESIDNEQAMIDAMSNPRFKSLLDSLAIQAGQKIGSIDNPSKLSGILRWAGIDVDEIPVFLKTKEYKSLTDLLTKEKQLGTTDGGILDKAIAHGFMKSGAKAANRQTQIDAIAQEGKNRKIPGFITQGGVTETPELEKDIATDLQRPTEELVPEGAPIESKDENLRNIGGARAGDVAGLKKIRKYKALMLALKAKKDLGKKVFSGATQGE